MYKWNVSVLHRIYRCSQVMILAVLGAACSQSDDSNSATTPDPGRGVGIMIPTTISAAAIDSCTKTAFITVDNNKPAREMQLTASMATITISGLTLETHVFEIEFFCNNQQFPQGILLASQSISKDIIAGGNSFNYPAELYVYADMDADGFNNLSELQANTNPNDPVSQPVLGVNEKVSDVITSSTHSPPLLVFNDVGDGIAVWETSSGTGRKILYSLYTFVTNQWSVETLIAAQANSTSGMTPQVATTGSDFAVVWKQLNDDNSLLSINSQFYTNGIWTAQQPIVSYEGNSFETAKIASNGSGYAVVWRQMDSQNISRLHTKVYDPSVSNSWGGAFTLSNPSSTEDVRFDSHQIVSNGSGYAITWEQPLNGISAVYANIFQGGSWLNTAKQLNTTGINTKEPILATNGSGYQFAWYQFVGTTEVRTRGYENSVWSTDISVKSNADQVYFDLVMASNGNNYAIAWTQQITGIFVNTGINNTWGAEQRLDITTLQNAWQPTIGSNQQGYMVTWSQNIFGGERNIYAALNQDGGATWQGAQLLDTETRSVSRPLIASGDSRYAVMWSQSNPSLTLGKIWVSIFDNSWSTARNIGNATGNTKLGSLFASNGRYVFSWEENTSTQASVVATQILSSSFGPTKYLIQNNHIGSVLNYKIVAADNGSVLTLWRQFHNGENRLYTRVYQNGAWEDSSFLSNSVFYNYYAVSNGSGFLISWAERGSTSNTLYTKLFIEGVWQSAISTAIPTQYWDMRLTSNGTGYALVWVDGFSFFASTYNGAVWSNWGNLGGFNSGEFELRSNQDGYAFTWDEGNVYASVFRFVDGWVTKELVQQGNSANGTKPIMATNSNNYMVAYTQADAGVENLYAGLYNGSSWGAQQNIDLISLTSKPTGYRLAATSTEFVSVWQQTDLQEANIYANVFSGASWQATPTKLEFLPGFASLPMLSISGNTSMSIWRQQNATQSDVFNVYANLYDGSAWQSSPALLEQGSEEVSTDPQITAQGNRFAAIWLQQQAGINDVHIAIFNDNAWREPIIVDSTQSLVIDPKVVSSSNSFSAAWKQVDPNSDPITVELFTRLNF